PPRGVVREPAHAGAGRGLLVLQGRRHPGPLERLRFRGRVRTQAGERELRRAARLRAAQAKGLGQSLHGPGGVVGGPGLRAPVRGRSDGRRHRRYRSALLARPLSRATAIGVRGHEAPQVPATRVSYELRALVAASPVASRLAARLPGSVAVPISQGLALVPMAGPWLSELANSPPVFDELDDPQLSREVVALVEDVSRLGPIAYISIDEQSDMTWQGAAAWSEGT